MLFLIAIDELFLMEPQVPKIALQLPKFILIGMVEAKSSVLSLDSMEAQSTVLINILQLSQKISIKLLMHLPSELILNAELRVDVFKCDFLITRLLIGLVVAIERDVI